MSFNLHDVIPTLPALPFIFFVPPPLHHADRRQQDKKATGWTVCQSTELKVESKIFEASVTPRPLIPMFLQSLNLKSNECWEGKKGGSTTLCLRVSVCMCVFPRQRNLLRVTPMSKLLGLVEKRLKRKIAHRQTPLVSFYCPSLQHKCSFHEETDSVSSECVKNTRPSASPVFIASPVFPTQLQQLEQYAQK